MSHHPKKARDLIALLKPNHAAGRLASSLALGVAAFALLRLRYSTVQAAVGGWDFAAMLLLVYAWHTIHRADASVTQEKAARTTEATMNTGSSQSAFAENRFATTSGVVEGRW